MTRRKKTTKTRRGRGEGACFYSESKAAWIARAVVGVNPDGSIKHKEISAKSKQAVLDKVQKAEDDARAGRFQVDTTKPIKTGDYLQHWLDNVSKPAVRESTWQSYERCVRLHLIPRIGGYKLAELRPRTIEALFAEMIKDGVSGGNAKKVSEVLSSALEHAVRQGMIPHSPAASVKKPKPEEEEIKPFTQAEAKKILTAANGLRLEAMISLAFATGARQGELLALGWDHLDLMKKVMRVERSLTVVKGEFIVKEPKSKRGRRCVELPTFAVEALNVHREKMLAEGNITAPVFCTATGNFTQRCSLINDVWRQLLTRARVPYRKFHTIRHTHISELLARGESIVDVARRVGDKPEVILKTYAHAIPGNAGKISRRLEEMYG